MPSDGGDLAGRVALVTGGGGAIGGACARALAGVGADVVIVDLRRDAAEARVKEIEALGRRALALVGDAGDYPTVEALAHAALGAMARVDVLVNVAGGGEPRPLLELTAQEFDQVLARNLKSAWNWAHCLAPQMLTRQGQRIVNTASISAKHGGGPPATVSRSAYAAAKAGVLGLTRGLARELAPHVTVNAVCPGLIETPPTLRITRGPDIAAIVKTIPMGRVGTPADVAAAVRFFASPAAGWITGECMDVNGGQYID
ncbi:MAG TPA: SDR family NAD(P)-dependent oxidoreductase [Methylomirabilota bacterium]|nr:SDR family NAD(P)-dependent oxidoreductase [Methylomirabilota bacterium]